MHEDSLFSTSSPTLVCWCIHDSHSDRCDVIFYCGFNLPFSDNWSLACPLCRSTYLGPLPIFKLNCLFLLCWVVQVFYKLWLLPDVSLPNILLHSVGCLFRLLMVSFCFQNLFSLMKCHLFIFSFVSLDQGDISEKILPKEML